MTVGDEFGRFSVSEGGSLVIDGVEKGDSGDWVCQARNAAGSAYTKGRLIVRGSANFYLNNVRSYSVC